MDPNYLDELKKLKEQKDADLDKLQEVARKSVPNLEETTVIPKEDPINPIVEIPNEEGVEDVGAETIKFEPVTQPTGEEHPAPTGGRRTRQPDLAEKKKKLKKKKKQKMILLVSLSSFFAVVAALLIVFFAVRNANSAKYFNEYWGMGIGIENGVTEYDFFGNIQTETRFDAIGQPEYVAEFKDGKCIKETKYNAEGDAVYYYTHEYDGDERVFSAYFTEGQMVTSEKYSRKDAQTLEATRTYHTGEQRTEEALITVVDGTIVQREVINNSVLILREKFDGTMIAESEEFDSMGIPLRKTVNEYDPVKKLLLKQIVYGADGTKQLSKVEYKYDEKTNLIREKSEFDENGDRIFHISYQYDANNNPVKEVSYEKSGVIKEQIDRVFNDKNRVVKVMSKDAQGKTKYCLGYDYDENGFVSKAITYNPQIITEILQYTLYIRSEKGTAQQESTYNASNILIEKKLFGASGLPTEHYAYTENGSLLLEEKMHYNVKQSLIQKDVTNYDELGQKASFLSEQYNDKNQVAVRIYEDFVLGEYEHSLFRYNQAGVAEQETVFDKNGRTLRDNTLDEKGRVLKETVYENSSPVAYNEYNYDENDRIILRKEFNLKTSVRTNYAYTYDLNGVLATQTERDAQDRVLNIKTFDELGFVIKQTNFDPLLGTAIEELRYEYDGEDRIAAIELYDGNGELKTTTMYYYREDGSHYTLVYGPDGEPITGTNPDESTDSNTDASSNGSSSETTDGGNETDNGTGSDSNNETSDTASDAA